MLKERWPQRLHLAMKKTLKRNWGNSRETEAVSVIWTTAGHKEPTG